MGNKASTGEGKQSRRNRQVGVPQPGTPPRQQPSPPGTPPRGSGAGSARGAGSSLAVAPSATSKPLPPPVPLPVVNKTPAAQAPLSKDNITGNIGDVFAVYNVEKKELGHGHYGTVRIGTHKVSGAKVAIKTIPKVKVSRPETLRREIEILRTVDHPNIIKLFEVFEDTRHLHLVTELCTGGELFDRIIARGHYTEADAAKLVRKILDAVKHCHDREICHRDLKPENFLFATKDETAELKVIDFGLSRTDVGGTGDSFMTTRVGTPYYIAPEVLGRHYDKSCDLWSIGVITYILLCGYPPFYGDSDPEIFSSVRTGKYSYDTPEWVGVSAEAKDLINHLLLLNPSKRLTAAQALQHPWLSGSAPSTERSLNGTILGSLKRFQGHNKLKKVALAVIADQLTGHEINELKKQFQKIDVDGNGVITMQELALAVRDMGQDVLEGEVLTLLQGIDIDGDGSLDYKEFLAATVKRNTFNKQEYLAQAFNYFDTKKQGVITKDDLVRFMGSEDHAQEVMDEIDTNGDGAISFDEFCAMMQHKNLGDEGTPRGDKVGVGFGGDAGAAGVAGQTTEL
ncbi:CAMK/CDPK protein kinase [Aphanomyces astaci]|uniref:Calcium-dependent protein kinase 1 n=1 Tax=Aphanomyces astaci TaxID=112090 RepID=W4H6R1_APHAT|nr:CAMK/CDPK protein kinase [Aphanomyces astaci]ETV86994.1 CAMK/CDPK protein kinase [Aphanomyces astaci]|eukprot:XP_009823793.1 CAMK/CDPK protein kinase [Aphanomyces astaci]